VADTEFAIKNIDKVVQYCLSADEVVNHSNQTGAWEQLVVVELWSCVHIPLAVLFE
jgi:hypothetical protein